MVPFPFSLSERRTYYHEHHVLALSKHFMLDTTQYKSLSIMFLPLARSAFEVLLSPVSELSSCFGSGMRPNNLSWRTCDAVRAVCRGRAIDYPAWHADLSTMGLAAPYQIHSDSERWGAQLTPVRHASGRSLPVASLKRAKESQCRQRRRIMGSPLRACRGILRSAPLRTRGSP